MMSSGIGMGRGRGRGGSRVQQGPVGAAEPQRRAKAPAESTAQASEEQNRIAEARRAEAEARKKAEEERKNKADADAQAAAGDAGEEEEEEQEQEDPEPRDGAEDGASQHTQGEGARGEESSHLEVMLARFTDAIGSQLARMETRFNTRIEEIERRQGVAAGADRERSPERAAVNSDPPQHKKKDELKEIRRIATAVDNLAKARSPIALKEESKIDTFFRNLDNETDYNPTLSVYEGYAQRIRYLYYFAVMGYTKAPSTIHTWWSSEGKDGKGAGSEFKLPLVTMTEPQAKDMVELIQTRLREKLRPQEEDLEVAQNRVINFTIRDGGKDISRQASAFVEAFASYGKLAQIPREALERQERQWWFLALRRETNTRLAMTAQFPKVTPVMGLDPTSTEVLTAIGAHLRTRAEDERLEKAKAKPPPLVPKSSTSGTHKSAPQGTNKPAAQEPAGPPQTSTGGGSGGGRRTYSCNKEEWCSAATHYPECPRVRKATTAPATVPPTAPAKGAAPPAGSGSGSGK